MIPGVGRSSGEGRLPLRVFWLEEFHGLYGDWGPKESDRAEKLSLLHYHIIILVNLMNTLFLFQVSLMFVPFNFLKYLSPNLYVINIKNCVLVTTNITRYEIDQE